MRQWMWGGGLAVASLLVAFLLFQRPDTGAEVDAPSSPGSTPGASTAPSGPRAVPASATEDNQPRQRKRTGDVATGMDDAEVSPELAKQRAWRVRPAATYANRVLAPVSAIRYVLMKEGTADARALADELGTGVMQDLRAVRSSEEEDPLTAIEPALAELATRIGASRWASDATIAKSLAKVNEQIAEFERVKAGEPMPVPGALPDPEAGGEHEAP
jgi:hypothetical protein